MAYFCIIRGGVGLEQEPIRVREMDKIGFQYPTIPRLTDWTIFIISNLDFLQAKICFCVSGGEELLSTSQKGYFRGVCGDGENCY